MGRARAPSAVDPGWRIKGWALKERLDKEKEEDWPAKKPKLEVVWSLKADSRPILDDNATLESLEEEISWIQTKLVEVLDEHVRKITICTRSKRWWNEDIRTKRSQLGRISRFRKAGKASQAAVREAKKALRRSIRRARRECWERFLEEADGNDIWAVPRYTRPQRSAAVPTISHRGVIAEDNSAKARILMDISFPLPVHYGGDEGQEGPPGTAFQAIDDRIVRRAFDGTSTKKSPGPDGFGPLAIRCLMIGTPGEW